MKTENELLNIQWNKYVKWTLRFPLILAGLACSAVLIAIVLAIGRSLAYSGNSSAIILMVISVLGISGISLGWNFYISRVMKASHKMFILLGVNNRKLAVRFNAVYILLSFLIFVIHIPYLIMDIVLSKVNVISFIPFFLLVLPILYFYYKIVNHYKIKNIDYNWKGISCE